MITSLLLMAFKKQAKVDGYKDAVTAFEHALITLVIKELTSNLDAQEINGLLQGRSDLFVKLLSCVLYTTNCESHALDISFDL